MLEWEKNIHISRFSPCQSIGNSKCAFVQPVKTANQFEAYIELEIFRIETHQQYESMATVLLANDSTLIFSDAFSKNGSSPVIPIIPIAAAVHSLAEPFQKNSILIQAHATHYAVLLQILKLWFFYAAWFVQFLLAKLSDACSCQLSVFIIWFSRGKATHTEPISTELKCHLLS